jgi:hypothetical protein
MPERSVLQGGESSVALTARQAVCPERQLVPLHVPREVIADKAKVLLRGWKRVMCVCVCVCVCACACVRRGDGVIRGHNKA